MGRHISDTRTMRWKIYYVSLLRSVRPYAIL